MKNTYIISGSELGVIIPELWYMETWDNNLCIFFTKTGWEITNTVLRGTTIHPSVVSPWGINSAFRPIVSRGDLHWLCIPIEDQQNQEIQTAIADGLEFLTEILNILAPEEAKVQGESTNNKQVQLFSLQTYHSSDEPLMHGAGLDVSISSEVMRVFAEHANQSIPGVRKNMKGHYRALDPSYRRVVSGDFSGVLRDGGTPHFTTYGSNCACLGISGHEHSGTIEDCGLYIDSHNINTPRQQLNMLIAIATTWKWVRTKLAYK